MPVMILSSVDLPEPLRPMMPIASPGWTLKLTSSSTRSSRNRRGRNSASACWRTVFRCTSGIRKLLRTDSTDRIVISDVLGGAGREPPEHGDADREDRRGLAGEVRVRGRGRDDAVDQHRACELDDG